MGHRDQLLAAARRLLEERGYARITARDLVAASDTNLASIGYHFGSKAALLNEAIEAAFEDYTEEIAQFAMAETDATPMERAGATWVAALEGFPQRERVLLAYIDAIAQAMRVPELQAQLAAHYARARGRVAELVAIALGDGISAEDPRCRAVAAVVIAACDGLAMQWLLDPEGMPPAGDVANGLLAVLDASYRPPDTSRTAGRTSAR